jgi:excisionase family DNA binding protein
MGITTRYNAVHRLIVDGRLPAVRVGRRIMLRREDLPVAARLLHETSAARSA